MENDMDILHTYVCTICDHTIIEFGSGVPICNVCGNAVKIMDRINTALLTDNGVSVIYDSLGTLDDDVASETDRIELERNLTKMDKVRRGLDVEPD